MGCASADRRHVVRFFDCDVALATAVADFVADGLDRAERVVLLITGPHWSAVRDRLDGRADVTAAMERDRLVVRDATEVLRRVSPRGTVDEASCQALTRELFDGATGPARVFGEVVSLAAAAGDLDGAITLERLGHEFADQAGVSVFCGYDLIHLQAGGDGRQRIEACHDAVLPDASSDPAAPVILLADDFEDGRAMYHEYLTFKGYRVVTASDGAEALERARAVAPALVLLDVRMPRMTGIEAMEALKRDPAFAGVPIVALTAHALDVERELFLASGFDAVLAKPCLPEELIQTVESLLAAR